MKKVFLFFTASLALFFVTSCDKAMNALTEPDGYKFSTKAGLDEILSDMSSKCDTTKFHITGFFMSEDEEYSGTSILYTVYIVDESESGYKQSFFHNGNVGDMDTNNSIRRAGWDSEYIHPGSYDTGSLVKALDEIKAMTPEGYTFKSVSWLDVRPDNIDVTVRMTKDGEETISNGGKTQEVYYEANYDINPKNWTIKD